VRFIASDAVPFLNLADELFRLSFDLIDVVVGQFSPLFADASLELSPLAFERVAVHSILRARDTSHGVPQCDVDVRIVSAPLSA